MKYTLGNKLMVSGLVVLFFIILMLVASQVVVSFFRSTSTHLVTEYKELDALQELRMSLGTLLVSSSDYAVTVDAQHEENFNAP